jgi:hypothetical protein
LISFIVRITLALRVEEADIEDTMASNPRYAVKEASFCNNAD